MVVPGITHEVIGTAVRSGSRPPDIYRFREETGSQHFLAYPDIDFEVQTLPEESGEQLLVRITVSLDAGGKVTHCTPNLPANVDPDLSRYANVACQQIHGVDVADPPIVDGEPVAHVRSLQIEFATAPKN